MISDVYTILTFVVASIVIVVVPGPTITVIVANSLKYGSKAGLLNILGTQFGLGLMLIPLALGFQVIIGFLTGVFGWLRFLGAAYLVWLGIRNLLSDGRLGVADDEAISGQASFFWQGFWVILSNPKVLLFFGAFLPQFISPEGNAGLQTLFLGVIFMILATFLDSLYAIAAGRVGTLLTKRNVRAVEITGGSMMIGGGVWLALTRA